ncbi:GyrI-like domain-containing protein [uncultured Zobellia sp.]|uniref:GyrI-like domain-containing protein n=1 Tax=uncultured Zobellia sp. TaxID=255433 RepID=UPI00259783FE|nr:GyrI-like domain-containing protein [uncultured Zobellia sp.]
MIKHEWRKSEKTIYLGGKTPTIIEVPSFSFITLSGAGNPNSTYFQECIGTLYSVAYAIKMNLKTLNRKPVNYLDWTVYPLEGVWDITNKAKTNFNGTINKDDLVFDLMIRQPDFVDQELFNEMLELVRTKKPNKHLEQVHFKEITEGKCIQMIHIGSYDNEHASFLEMERYATQNNLVRISKIHREIYLNDFRRVPEEKLKTMLRFNVQ